MCIFMSVAISECVPVRNYRIIFLAEISKSCTRWKSSLISFIKLIFFFFNDLFQCLFNNAEKYKIL